MTNRDGTLPFWYVTRPGIHTESGLIDYGYLSGFRVINSCATGASLWKRLTLPNIFPGVFQFGVGVLWRPRKFPGSLLLSPLFPSDLSYISVSGRLFRAVRLSLVTQLYRIDQFAGLTLTCKKFRFPGFFDSKGLTFYEGAGLARRDRSPVRRRILPKGNRTVRDSSNPPRTPG